mgnify:CR=1 FL=1
MQWGDGEMHFVLFFIMKHARRMILEENMLEGLFKDIPVAKNSEPERLKMKKSTSESLNSIEFSIDSR